MFSGEYNLDQNIEEFAAQSFKNLSVEIEELQSYRDDPENKDFLSLKFGDLSSDGSAIVGKEGHLFIKDGANKWADQIKGLHPNLISSSDIYENLLKERLYKLSMKGIKYFHVIYPEKDVIYPELSPNLDGIVISEDRIASKLEQSKSNFLIYPRNDLLELKKYGYLFLKRNSHLNFFGGYFSALAVVKKMGFELPSLSQVKYKLYKWPDDLSLKFAPALVTTRPVLIHPGVESLLSEGISGGHVGKKLLHKNDNAITGERVLLFGDSYSWNPDAGLAKFLSFIFKEVLFVWNTKIDYFLVDEFKPDIVITESAERFHINPPVDVHQDD